MQTDPDWSNIQSGTLHPITRGTGIGSGGSITRNDEPTRSIAFIGRSGTSQGVRLRASALLAALPSGTSNNIRIEYTGILNVAGSSQIRLESVTGQTNAWTSTTTGSGSTHPFSQTLDLTREQLQATINASTNGDITLGATPANANLTITGIVIKVVPAGTDPTPTPTPTPISTPDPTVSTLTVSTVFADPGDEVKVQIRISDNPGFATMFMRIEFPDELTLENYTLANADLQVSFTPPHDLIDVGDYVFMGWEGRTENIILNGELLTLTFSVCPNMATNRKLPITVTFGNAYGGENTPENVNGDKLNIHIVNGEVRVQPPKKGDVGGSGHVTSESATILAHYLAKYYVTIDLRAANITCGEGQPTTADLTRLARVLVGIYPTFCPHGGCERCN